ncbi:glycosyl hydrolase [Ilyonectria sp. MPI-CAGE-AT-0026]|nr:glycosyl hydrolase [Ilyonectria sp. MPI-CAGE-AT-0026]
MSTDDGFVNPIIPGFNPDPSICRVGDDFFLVTSTFEYFPGIPIYHSKDLLAWTLIGHVLTRRSQLEMRTTEPSGGVWAPTLRYHQGTFYVSVGCTQRFRPKEWDITIPRGFYVTTTDIRTKDSWSDPIYFDVPGIDQDLFFDDDGKVYFSAVNQVKDPKITKHGLGLATFTAEIDLNTGSCVGPIRWNRMSEFGFGIAEGPHIFRKDGYYYLSTAEGGTDEGHQQWIHRSKVGPFGPWETPGNDVNPIIFNDMDMQVRNTGHLDFIETSDGRWWAVFLGVRPQGDKAQFKSQLGRETFLAPVQWIDGWPVVNGRKNISLEMNAPGMQRLTKPQSWRDDFEGPELQLGWYHLRTPLKQAYEFDAHQNSLLLYGGANKIWDFECPSMLLQKQVHFSLDWRVEMNFAPMIAEEEAGTAIWWSQFAYASIGLRRTSNGEGMEIICRYLDEKNEFQQNTSPLNQQEADVQFVIKARALHYDLGYMAQASSELEAAFVKMGSITSESLTHRVPGRESPNTGAHFAIYAQGSYDMPCFTPACFKSAEWEVVS